jgi:hypothetical protein
MLPPLTVTVDGLDVPHWALQPEDTWDFYESFPEFTKAVWAQLRLPAPTRRQLQIAQRLQEATSVESARDIVRAFRGVGKSYLTAAFVIWRLMRNPRDEKVLIVSATGTKAKDFVSMVKTLIRQMPLLAGLVPREDQRDMADAFDVNGSSVAQSKSVTARGITSQITGGRATLIVADDVEIPANSKTEDARTRLLHYTSEFEAIILPGGDVVFLGTPQTEESIYNRLVKERGYSSYTVPARFPSPEKREGYLLKDDNGHTHDILARELIEEFEAGTLKAGDATDPERFNNRELTKREGRGRAFFALQYMLDTSLSDAERYPLKQRDLMVMSLNADKAPRTLAWGLDSHRLNVIGDIPNLGFSGDMLLGPLFRDAEWRDYEGGGVLFVDPAGRGKDETAWAVVKTLNGLLYVLRVAGHKGTPAEAMVRIALDAKRFKVSLVEVEPNMAGGIWIEAFKPVLLKTWPGGCTVTESEWAKGQKETRIIDTLEPVMTGHRLVFDEGTLKDDAGEADRDYSLLYQLTHITRDRGSLAHDDRVDAVAGAVAHLQRALGLDVDQAAKDQRDEEMDRYVERYVEEVSKGHLGRTRGIFRDGKRQESIVVSTSGRPAIVYSGDDDDETPNAGGWRSSGAAPRGWR